MSLAYQPKSVKFINIIFNIATFIKNMLQYQKTNSSSARTKITFAPN